MSKYKYIKIGKLYGAVSAPPSKSITHRLLIMAALSGKTCEIKNPLYCEDTRITIQGLNKFGYEIRLYENRILITGEKIAVKSPVEINVGNSGTSARFLTVLSVLQPVESCIDGNDRMRNRPMKELIDSLRQLGISVDHHNGFLPVRIKPTKTVHRAVRIDISRSSQFLSALLLIAPLLKEGLEIKSTGTPVSRFYSDMTCRMMQQAGIIVEGENDTYSVAGSQSYDLGSVQVEGDYSNAAYYIAGSAITGGEIRISNLIKESFQGDQVIIEMLRAAGADIYWRDNAVLVKGNRLKGIEWNMDNNPDLVPVMSVMALFAEGSTILKRIGHLKYKESNRIQAIVHNAERLGGKATVKGDDLIINPEPLKGDMLLSFNDHRIAMSFALSGLKIPGVKIENPGCVEKSYPDFWNDLDLLTKIS